MDNHYQFLASLHQALEPSLYLETGVENGRTLALAQCKSIGIDPYPQVTETLPDTSQVFAMTSDDFFAQHDVGAISGGDPIDFAFIDGLHLFEAALRDFINIEKYSHAGTVVCIHDVVPSRVDMADREPNPNGWTGDVFGLILALREHRPDLFSTTIDIPQTGMFVVSKLDPSNNVLIDNFDAVCAQHLAIDYSKIHDSRSQVFVIRPYSAVVTDYLAANARLAKASRENERYERMLRGERGVRLGSLPQR